MGSFPMRVNEGCIAWWHEIGGLEEFYAVTAVRGRAGLAAADNGPYICAVSYGRARAEPDGIHGS